MFARQILSVESVNAPGCAIHHLSLVHFKGGGKYGTYLNDAELAVARFLDEQLKTEAGRAALDLLEKFEKLVVAREHVWAVDEELYYYYTGSGWSDDD